MFLEPIDWTDVESRGCRLDGFLRASGCTAFKYGGGTQKLSWRFGRGLDLESVSGIGRETAQGWTQMVFRHSGRPRREVADEEQRRGDQRLILSTRAASGWWGIAERRCFVSLSYDGCAGADPSGAQRKPPQVGSSHSSEASRGTLAH